MAPGAMLKVDRLATEAESAGRRHGGQPHEDRKGHQDDPYARHVGVCCVGERLGNKRTPIAKRVPAIGRRDPDPGRRGQFHATEDGLYEISRWPSWFTVRPTDRGVSPATDGYVHRHLHEPSLEQPRIDPVRSGAASPISHEGTHGVTEALPLVIEEARLFVVWLAENVGHQPADPDCLRVGGTWLAHFDLRVSSVRENALGDEMFAARHAAAIE